MDAIAAFRQQKLQQQKEAAIQNSNGEEEKPKVEERKPLDKRAQFANASKKRQGGDDLRQRSLAMYKSINNMLTLVNQKDFSPMIRITREEAEGVILDFIYRELQSLGPLSKEEVEEMGKFVGKFLEGDLKDALYIKPEEKTCQEDSPESQNEPLTSIQFFDAPKLKELLKKDVVNFRKAKENASTAAIERNDAIRAEAFVGASQGQRKAMEDQCTILSHLPQLFGLPNDPACAFYAVYDGHSGKSAAEYVRTQLHVNLCRSSHFPTDIPTALSSAFVHTDALFNRMATREGMNSGTTAASVLLKGSEMIVANVGDSEIVLSRRGKAMVLSQAHLPNQEEEKERIQAAGGTVVWYGAWRVNGLLSVSRSIGDPNLQEVVIPQPFCKSYPREEGDQFLILATDGLWDAMAHQEACDFVTEHLRTHPKESCPQALVDEALRKGSTDNVTVILVLFDNEFPSTS